MKAMKTTTCILTTMAMGALWSCEEETPDKDPVGTDDPVTETHNKMDGTAADCEFDMVTFTIAAGTPQEVSLNGLPVAELRGADKVSSDAWEVVTRRGVRFADILTKAQISQPDETPVNCVARDGFDPLRTKLEGDTTLLPTFAFLRDHGYLYVGNPGDKDPLYPDMEGKSLIVDYDMGSDAAVPAELGGTIASLGMFRWKMVEKVDAETRGIIELGPVVK